MVVAAKCPPVLMRTATVTVDRQIRDFLAERNNGEGPLHALYDHVLDEPVPERLRAALRG